MGSEIVSSRKELPASTTPRIGLALGGGGARGFAHLIALETLEELGVAPVAIAGTSIGAIFGAGAAAGLSAAHMRAHVEEVLSHRYALVRQLFSVRAPPVERLFNLLPVRAALLDPEALLEAILPSRLPSTFAALGLPLEVVATDFYAQVAVVLSEGPLRPAIAASMALPVIFQPVTLAGRVLMDGGLVDPLPYARLRQVADVVIAIDVSGAGREPGEAMRPGAIEALLAASQILQRSIVREKLRTARPDILLDMPSQGFGVLEFHRFRDIMAAAEPMREVLKRQLGRILNAETVEAKAIGLEP
ncbi:MAG: patatin-like phospholipase family protein [Hyphomicrobiaceae bacterium]|nr:patatin-like phospholipase family protein [Hyphomicrobiaceae bacterium]